MLWNAKNGQVPLDRSVMPFVSFGRGEKALILLPGLSDGLMTVSGKALLLAKPYRPYFDRYTVYMFSRRDPLPKGCSIRDMAADQARAMGLIGLKKAAVMGVSEGGMVAQCLAIDHPELVEALVVAVSAPRVNASIRSCIAMWTEDIRRNDHRQLMIDTAEKSYSAVYLRRYRKLYPFLGAVGKPPDYGRFLINAEAILSFDVLRELAGIRCPTLIIGGGKDQIVGIEASREMHRGIPGSKLYVYPDLGHAAYEEAEDFNERVFRFLDAASEPSSCTLPLS